MKAGSQEPCLPDQCSCWLTAVPLRTQGSCVPPAPHDPLWLLTCFLRVSSSSPQGGRAACALGSNSFQPGFRAVVGGSHLHGSSGSSWPALFQVFLFLLMTLDCLCSWGTAWELWFSLPPVSHSCFFSKGVKVPHPCRPLFCIGLVSCHV